MNTKQLTIFFDGQCPLCTLEMQRLKEQDKDNQILLVDLHQEDFKTIYPEINIEQGLAILHGQYKGKILLGLDVTHRAWTLVGKGWLVAPLQWPIIRPLSHQVYLLVARYRQPISNFIYQRFGIGIKHCEQGTCYGKPNDINHRSK
ncbi:DUF393 domain-containing protein [Psychromonas sp. 14N.309.X.WAT.B.A12]|uniref:thiol-disulfide oxidoreductase DCC family protein n=1 Tax=Psychromonas sp. 14N.309.X.WAT.B.A12 TaxID=2998322 RepID=UPI0025B01EC1|nr:DUF393 domain-containing protein [Psychromonas sp. 14N.309.X.WAT.B.A12]MDN2664440.1 DUF393 domain-containing protein [Psychromonas sp. 14N.309.X.WAT.B.A12]